jgi:hypothetical protein
MGLYRYNLRIDISSFALVLGDAVKKIQHIRDRKGKLMLSHIFKLFVTSLSEIKFKLFTIGVKWVRGESNGR